MATPFPANLHPLPARTHLRATHPLPLILLPTLRTKPRLLKTRHLASVIDNPSPTVTQEPDTPTTITEPATSPNNDLPNRWRDIHGRFDWAGLLDPLDPLLRSELIRYGEFTQACYDSYDFDIFSIHGGSCKYPRRQFFASLGMGDCGYEVTRYLYATANIKLPNFSKKQRVVRSWSEKANWIGYVAVSGDEETARLGRRDIVVAWRGTVTKLEWVADLMDFLRPLTDAGIPSPNQAAKVETGFLELYTDKDPTCRFCKYSAREQVLTEVSRLVRQYSSAGEDVSVSVMGHSLGSALATLSAYDLAATGATKGATAVCVFSFAGPRVGNGAFKDEFEAAGVKVIRVLNVHDKVPKVPGILFNEGVPDFVKKFVDWLPWTYSHVGVEIALDHKESPFLSDTPDITCYHNLEAHLHLLDGYQGKGQKFEQVIGRDPALVNKSCDFLKDDHGIPPNWRQDMNKGMIRTEDGRWVQPPRAKLEDHPVEIEEHLQQLGLGVGLE